MLYKTVNGQKVLMTAEEETAIRAEWVVNDTAKRDQATIDAQISDKTKALIEEAKADCRDLEGVLYDKLTEDQHLKLNRLLAIKIGAVDVFTKTMKPLDDWM